MLYKQKVPAYQARVILGGRHVYLGRCESAESREAYAHPPQNRLPPA